LINLVLENTMQVRLKHIMDKIKIEIDLLKDSLRNLFVVMFAIMSGEVSLIYKILHNKYNLTDFALLVIGFLFLFIIDKVKQNKNKQIQELLERLNK